jgi:tripartite-type tricarboxylate transporter receptor subunit TctC
MLAKLLAGALLLWLCGAASSQQKWPSRNIEIIIPLSPDSGVDLIGRAVATA